MSANTETKTKGSMIKGNPTKPLILFTLPMIIGNLFQQLYNIIDSIIVGNYVGESALAAVGASTAITMLFIMVALGTGIGCSVVISQLFGAKQMEKMKTAVATTLISVLVLSIILSVLGMFLSKGILRLMGTPENIFGDAAVYLNIYFYGFAFLFLYNALSSIFNALGDSMKPLIFLMISSVLNVILDLFFVVNLGMGVAGVAWATLIAQGASCILSFCFLMFKLRRIESEEYVKFDPRMLRGMIVIAIPTIFQQAIVSIGMLLVQAAVNRFGSTFLAGYTAALKIDSIAIVPMVAVGNAMSTFVAQNMGARQPERVSYGYKICITMAAGIGLLVAVIIHFFGDAFIGLFMDSGSSRAAIAIGAEYLSIVSIFYFIMGIMNVTNGILRGSGDMRWFLAVSILNLLTRVGLTYALADQTEGMIVMWAIPLGWLVALVVSSVRYYSGGWKVKSVI